MTSEQRTHLKAELDRAARARLEKWRQHNPDKACSGCGMPYDARTPGCSPCADRDHRRAKRERDAQPCAGGCGTTVQPPHQKRYWMKWTGLCRQCYWASLRERAAA